MGVKRKLTKSKATTEITIGEAFTEFLVEKRSRNLSRDTIRNYELSIKLFKEFCEFDDDTLLSEITLSDFYKWMGTMNLEGVKATSINHYLRDCRVFFYWCMVEDRKYIERRFKIEMIKGQEESVKCFNEEDLETLLIKPGENEGFTEWRTWAIVSWILATGNRSATICEIKIGDINFKTRDISLRHTKSGKAQLIPMSSSLETVLKQYIKAWRSDASKDSWLFPNIGDEKLTTNALRHSFTRYCNDRGIEQTNIHGLRHSFARNWVRSSGSVFELQRMLGHSTLAMTQRYVKLFSEDIKESIDEHSALDNLKRSTKRTMKVKRG